MSKETVLLNIDKAIEALKQARRDIERGETGENEDLCRASILIENAYNMTCR